MGSARAGPEDARRRVRRSAPASSARSSAPSADADAERDAWLTFVVIGGGPTGVEMAGTMSEIAQHTLRARVPPHRLEAHARDPARRLDRASSAPSCRSCRSARASSSRSLGVDVRTGSQGDRHRCRRRDLRQRATATAASQRLAARTVIWAAGVAGSPLGAELGARHRRDARPRRPRRRRARPEPARPPEIAVVGDLAAALSHGKGEPTPVPGVSPGAKQMGRAAAANIVAPPARRADAGRSATATTATWRRSAARPRSSTSPCPASARCASAACRPGCSGCSPTSTS